MLRVLVGVSLLLTLVTPVVVEAAPTGNVEVVHLGVDGRTDSPVGLGNPYPTLSWQLIETRQAQSHPCHRPSARVACPGDRQTAYEVQAARTVRDLAAGRLLWTTGHVPGAEQRVAFGAPLRSRDTVAWRVRVWDADSQPPRWSDPVTWSMGLLEQNDWGTASWIDYPDRAAHQPLPIFARQFTIPRGQVPAGTTVRMALAESLNADGTVNQASLRRTGHPTQARRRPTLRAQQLPDTARHRAQFVDQVRPPVHPDGHHSRQHHCGGLDTDLGWPHHRTRTGNLPTGRWRARRVHGPARRLHFHRNRQG